MTKLDILPEEIEEQLKHHLPNDEKIKVELYYSEKSSRYGFTQFQNTYLNNSLRFADAKAGALVAVNGLILKFVMDYLKGWQGLEYWLGVVSIALFILSICTALIVVYPRSHFKKGRGFIYWGYIAKESLEDYKNQIQNEPIAELLEESIRNNYFQAIVLDGKFKSLSIAFMFSYIAYILLAIAAISLFIS